ncbi:serine/threonine protein kinase, partial [Streptomyces sp. NPDC056061]
APAGRPAAAPKPVRPPATAARGAATTAAAPPARPAPSSAVPAPPRASLTDVVPRRTLAIIAAVVVLAVVATVLALTLGGDDDKGAKGSGKGDTSASAGASTTGSSPEPDSGTGGRAEDGAGGQEKGQDTEQGKDDAPKGDKSGEALPDGYTSVANKQYHFTMAMPGAFTFDREAGKKSGAIYNADGGFPRVQVDYTDSPGGDAAAAWNAAKAGVAATSNGYHHLGVKNVQYNGYPTVADWQFERTQQGQRVRVLNRGFKVDAKHGYAIMISCPAKDWDGEECRTLRKTAFDTFAPTD